MPKYDEDRPVPNELRGYSRNTIAYYELWRRTLHQNCYETTCTCHIGAIRLTQARVINITRGMPDLPKVEEDAIWQLAFSIHDKHGGIGTIRPTWSVDKFGTCDCFEKAMKELAPLLESKPGIPQVILNPEDAWYEPRIE